MKTFKYQLKPTADQAQKILSTLNLCRLLYNTGLEQRIFAFKKRGISLSFYTQKKELSLLKKELPFFKDVHSQVLQDVLNRLEKAYQAFFRRLKTGGKAGFPRFQGANRYHSFTYTQSGFSLTGNSLKLSKIGTIAVKRHRRLQGRAKTCTIRYMNSSFYVCFSCEVQVSTASVDGIAKAVGVDLGVKYLAITSDGSFLANPNHLRKLERKLKSKQRTLVKKKKGSNRRRKAVHQLAKLHEHIANKRSDTAHKASRQLVERYDLLVFEDLNIQRMVTNHRYAKSIVDSGWRQLIHYTTYKAENAGKRVVLVNPYNTTQRCSHCQALVKKTINDRTHRCLCGYTADRDVNAAKNILQLGLKKIS